MWNGFRSWIEGGYKLLAATSTGAFGSVLILLACYRVADDADDFAYLLLLALLGVLLGWILAIGLSPYDPKEKFQFSSYAQAAGVFVSGYLFARLDKVITRALDPGSPAYLFAPRPGAATQALIFTNSALLSLIVVFTHRQYRQKDEFERRREVALDKREEAVGHREEALHHRERALDVTPLRPDVADAVVAPATDTVPVAHNPAMEAPPPHKDGSRRAP